MDRFIALANIAHFQDLLVRETDPEKRRIIEDLLARERQKLETAERKAHSEKTPNSSSEPDDYPT